MFGDGVVLGEGVEGGEGGEGGWWGWGVRGKVHLWLVGNCDGCF